MLLLTGPHAAGKTSYCLSAFRNCLRSKEFNCRLLVPTSTMAEHLRNQLAREGFVFSPRLISTLGRFVDELVPGLPSVSPGTLELITTAALAETPAGRYSLVQDYPGFRAALARAMGEFSGAGGEAGHLPLIDVDFAAVYERVTAALKRRSLYLRSQRMACAAMRIEEVDVPRQVWITGFSAFTTTEMRLLRALSARSNVTITLPQKASGDVPLEGITEHRILPDVSQTAPRTLVISNTPDEEASDIARRILLEANRGRSWRDFGVVLRDGTMVPVMRTAFERFGIPARFYFAPLLVSDPTVRYLLEVVKAAIGGWSWDVTVEALRMHGSPLERTGDRWEYAVREDMPGSGLEMLRATAPDQAGVFFNELEKLTPWATAKHLPSAWSMRFASLSGLFRPSPVSDGIAPHLWRDQAAAIDAFQSAVEETAAGLPAVAIGCSEFLAHLKTILQSVSLRMIDRRRDVVHVIDAMEARQWKLPVVFIAGLLEGRFPRHHSESPILSDEVRLRLRDGGVQMKTSGEKQVEEQALFDVALTRATSHTFLSYARLNGKGEANLPSFLLKRAKPFHEEAAAPVRPQPARCRAAEPLAVIDSPELRQALEIKHASLSPSAIETYATCPYAFFGARSLRLRTPPEDPYDRLDMRVQGDIAHLTLELHFRDGTPVNEAFATAFALFSDRCRIPAGYRTEAVRLELLYGIQQLAADERACLRGTQSIFEESFCIDLGEGTTVRGRIDRMEVDEHGNALIFDYKYRRAYRLKDTLAENESGERVQTGMYLLGARSLKLSPIGMAYCGFKKEVSVGGWVIEPFYPELKAACKEEQLSEVIAAATQTAIQASSDIRAGRIAPEPVDEERCQWCSFINICRYEIREAQQAVRGMRGA